MRPTPIVATAVLAASFLVAPVASLPSSGPVTPTSWVLPLSPAAAAAVEPSVAATEPAAAAQPAPAQPAATQPAATQPAATQPAATQPAADPTPGTEVLAVEAQETEPFDLVAVTWAEETDGPAPQVQVRVLEDGTWTGWEQLPAMDEGPDAGTEEYERARAGTSPLLTSQAEGVEVRLVAADDAVPTDARVELVDAGTTGTTPVPLASASAATPGPALVTRAAWGADESLKNGGASYAGTIKAGVVHHTASTNSYTAAQAAGQVRAIYAYHTNSLGWNDIGYNYLVDRFGTIYEGRAGGLDRAVVGAHSGGFNSETVGVSAIGNYEVGAAPAAMVESIGRVLGWKLGAFGRDPNGSTTLVSAGGGTSRWSAGTSVTVRTVIGHRDIGLTACPGANLYPALGTIRAGAAAYIAEAAARHNPGGALERAGGIAGGVQLAGHVKDPDTSSPVALHVYVDGGWGGAFTAATPRQDGKFGFDVALPVSPGSHQVCVYAINQGEGTSNPQLGCSTVTRPGGNPFGSLDGLGPVPGGARMSGWVLDPDDTGAVALHVYVDGRWGTALRADRSRPDVGGVYPLMGSQHGFDLSLDLPAGPHEVCVYAINVGAGTTNPLVGCGRVSVMSGNPTGNFEGIRAGSGQVVVEGWTLDPDIAGAIPVHVYVDGRWGGQLMSSGPRPDVRAYYPGYSEQRGFSLALGAARGSRSVCVYAINVGAGTTNPLVGCRTVTVG